ncbi:D-inositol 3-phosphate glycosyltransferase [Botrimarina colliarenosi]|uniref:D-inositol 3-phosphate glycosyltransferase n=1 Tax=Botrimarina colliarenosi TaxID=2528001 RepID=A0A5C6AL87_9BACT|nr:glycosyltransferase [Botrimarina colliarenosi]TWT99945.1 D-inositol 3-phosphate glycosyltransferase [Botrimarina colliarenosi]
MSLSVASSAPTLAPPPEIAPVGPVAPAAPLAAEPPRGVARPTVRVLHVVNGEHYSGAERVQDLLGMALPSFGYSVAFASLKPGKFGDHRRSVACPLHEVEMRGRWNLGVARRLAKLVRQEDYSLLHAHTPRSLLVAYLASRLAGVPLVYHVHSPASRDSTRRLANWSNHFLERGCANRADQLVTVSPTLTNHMRTMGVSPDKLRCVLNGVPPLTEEEARRRRKPIAPYTVAMVALFRPRKGVEVLIDALANLRSRELDVHLEAIGPFESAEYEDHIRSRVKKLGLEEHIHWTGFTDNVPAALARADALALPSLFGEGLPMVVLEAMAAGLPVVATRCEGTTEAILHRETGFLVEPGSVSQLADALEELFNGETDYPLMSLLARERHLDHFSDQAMARSLAGVYDGVLRQWAKK